MTALARHTKANREFFEPGCCPHVSEWVDWIQRGVVRGKIIDGKPYIDLNWFAANTVMNPAPAATPGRIHGSELLKRHRAANL